MSALPKAIGSLADALLSRPAERTAAPSRVHRLGEDDEDLPAGVQKAVLVALEVGPLNTTQIAEATGIDAERVKSACVVLVKRALIHGQKGKGYHLGPKPASSVLGAHPMAPTQQQPEVQQPPQEEAMPRKKKDAAAAATTPPAGEQKKRQYTKRAGAKPGKKPRATVGVARYQIDDRGGMSIEDGQQSIKLEADDVKRLEAFLSHTKSIRA